MALDGSLAGAIPPAVGHTLIPYYLQANDKDNKTTMVVPRTQAARDLEKQVQDTPIVDRLSLKRKNFLITGGGRGIGFACAKAIAQLGGGVGVIDALPEPVEEFHTLSSRYGVKTFFTQGDVTKPDSLEKAFAEAVAAIGQFHGGLTAAGIARDQKLIDADWETTTSVINVNLLGTFWAAKLLAKHMVETKTPGSIVLIASLSAQGLHVPVSNFAIYNASKAAVKGIVGPLSVELGPHRIRVNSISPGAILTPMTAALEAGGAAALLNWYTEATAAGRCGIPQDLTPMVCLLLSDAGSYINGADHLIDGAIHAGRCDPFDLASFSN